MSAKVNDFMLNLGKELMEKKGLAETTSNLYLRALFTLNKKLPFKNLAFLKQKEGIMAQIAEYAASTQKSLLAAIVSVLGLVSDKATYKSIHKYYYDEMMSKVKADKEAETSDMTDKQKENWISWKDILEISRKQREKMLEYANKKSLTFGEYDHLLQTLVLSLYVSVQPRRNQDYLNMDIVKNWNDKMPSDTNYLDLAGQRFIFNKYKTAKKYGQQMLPIPSDGPNPFMDVLNVYLKHHAPYKASKGKTAVPFLVAMDGKPFTAVNSITRILNKIFGKKVGSSMLRHIFLSDKYDITEMETDAAAMGHSVDEQKKYMKTNAD